MGVQNIVNVNIPLASYARPVRSTTRTCSSSAGFLGEVVVTGCAPAGGSLTALAKGGTATAPGHLL